MDYGIRHAEPLLEAVRRIAREQVELASAELRADEPSIDVRVHEIRKRLKKLRGLLGLVAGSFREKRLASWNRSLRQAGRRLAPARRGAVLLATFDDLLASAPDLLGTAPREALRAELERHRAQALAAMRDDDEAARVEELLRGFLADLESCPEKRHARAAETLEQGYRRSYRESRRQLERVRHEPSSEGFHDLRKLAKGHFHHVRLLRRVWPAQLRTVASSLEELGELLGHEHDLDDLRLWLIERARAADLLPSTRALLDRLQARRRELRALALELGASAFAERPREAGRRFAERYAAWLAEPAEPAADELELDP